MIRLIWIHQLFSFLVICLFDNRIIWEYAFQLSLQIFQTVNSNSSVVFFLVVPLTTWCFFFDRIVKYFFDFFGFRCEKLVNCKYWNQFRWQFYKFYNYNSNQKPWLFGRSDQKVVVRIFSFIFEVIWSSWNFIYIRSRIRQLITISTLFHLWFE